MITKEPTASMLKAWKATWRQYKDILQPNRKTAEELFTYLHSNYKLTEMFDQDLLDSVIFNITMNQAEAEKLPLNTSPIPRVFILENDSKGAYFYQSANQDPIDLWGEDQTEIMIGIDMVSGYYEVTGSTLLWDELCAFLGLDELDLQNYVCVGVYIDCLTRLGKLTNLTNHS